MCTNNVNTILKRLYQKEHQYYKLTVLPHWGHEIWSTVYDSPEVYEWLLSQSLTNNQTFAK